MIYINPMDPIWVIFIIIYILIYYTKGMSDSPKKHHRKTLTQPRWTGNLAFSTGWCPSALACQSRCRSGAPFPVFRRGLVGGVGWVVLVELDGFLQNSGPSFCWANFEGHQIFDDEDLSFPPKNKTGWLYYISWLVGWVGWHPGGPRWVKLCTRWALIAAWKNGDI